MLLTIGWISSSQFSANQDKQWLLWQRFISFSSLRNQTAEATTVVAMTTIHLFPIAEFNNRAAAPVSAKSTSMPR